MMKADRNQISEPLVAPSEGFQKLSRGNQFPYSAKEYLARLAGLIVQNSLLRFSPPRLNCYRRSILRMLGAKVGKGCSFWSTVRVTHPWLFEVGDYSVIGPRVNVYNLGKIIIGSNTVISQGVHLCAGTHDYTDPAFPLIRSEIIVGDGVWIAAEAFIGPSVTIGDHAVVGARAVVTRDVAPWTVVAGNPAKPVKERKIRASVVAKNEEMGDRRRLS